VRPSQLATKLPDPPEDADPYVKSLVTALVDILKSVDDFQPLRAAGGNLLVGNRPLMETANSGFLYVPTIDGNGPPQGTPTKYGAGDPIVYTRDDQKLWIYSFERSVWEEFPQTDDDNEILVLLLMILREMEFQREMESNQ
jgi:hypothetical protein